MFCEMCGTSLPTDASFCTSCGAQVSAPSLPSIQFESSAKQTASSPTVATRVPPKAVAPLQEDFPNPPTRGGISVASFIAIIIVASLTSAGVAIGFREVGLLDGLLGENISTADATAQAAKAKELGRTEGQKEGFSDGESSGYERGLEDGRAEGVTEGQSAAADEYQRGYDVGRTAGLNEGFDEGKAAGVKEGKASGYDDGYSTGFEKGCSEVFSSLGFDYIIGYRPTNRSIGSSYLYRYDIC
jgi:flagellar biosynthesis/type III secretory pathway protein FliH